MNSKPLKGQAVVFDHDAYFQSAKALFTTELRQHHRTNRAGTFANYVNLSQWLLTDLLNNE